MSATATHAISSEEQEMTSTTMKAIVNYAYGSPDVLELQEIDRPVIGDDEMLLRVRAASVNPLDWHFMRGEPYFVRLIIGLRRPKRSVRGVDVAAHVEAVGKNVSQFQPGDEVFGVAGGAFAEYVAGEAYELARKPSNLNFEQAAAVPAAACTALQALRDHGQLQAGQRVLVNGASGGVGTFAVQIAKAFGGQVTGVCSTKNVDLVSSIGAEEVVDYTREDFTLTEEGYDLIVDAVGNRSLKDLRRALTPTGTVVLVGGEGTGKVLGSMAGRLRAVVLSRFVRQRLVSFIAKIENKDLVVLKELIETGTVRPVIDRTCPLSETPEAVRYLETRHASGKVVITM